MENFEAGMIRTFFFYRTLWVEVQKGLGSQTYQIIHLLHGNGKCEVGTILFGLFYRTLWVEVQKGLGS